MLHARPLREDDLPEDPFEAFAAWFAEAREHVRIPEAMAVATASPSGQPACRMLLLKGFDRDGFVFFTSYESRKGHELQSNPSVSLLFYWDPLGRQVRIDGSVSRVSESESDEYFATRPIGARLTAIASHQSQVIDSRGKLEVRVEEIHVDAGPEPGRPVHWGGYRVRPDEFEFWQHRDDRLHDRLRYRRSNSRWIRERLAP